MAKLVAHVAIDKDVIRWTNEKLAEAIAAMKQVCAERDEARNLAREILGHLDSDCFQRGLGPDHWLFRKSA